MTLPDRVRLPLAFEPAALQRDLELLSPQSWVLHYVPQNYEGEWSVLPLRAPKGAIHPIRMIYADPAATEFEDTPLLALCPAIRAALAHFRCPLHAVRLMRLTPGSAIKEHNDHDLDAENGVARIHLPITSNPGVTFELNHTLVVMAPGTAWYLRLSDNHRAANNGKTDRSHLVVDAVVNGWLKDLLERGARDAAVEAAADP
jgi:hypothetical protein